MNNTKVMTEEEAGKKANVLCVACGTRWDKYLTLHCPRCTPAIEQTLIWLESEIIVVSRKAEEFRVTLSTLRNVKTELESRYKRK